MYAFLASEGIRFNKELFEVDRIETVFFGYIKSMLQSVSYSTVNLVVYRTSMKNFCLKNNISDNDFYDYTDYDIDSFYDYTLLYISITNGSGMDIGICINYDEKKPDTKYDGAVIDTFSIGNVKGDSDDIVNKVMNEITLKIQHRYSLDRIVYVGSEDNIVFNWMNRYEVEDKEFGDDIFLSAGTVLIISDGGCDVYNEEEYSPDDKTKYELMKKILGNYKDDILSNFSDYKNVSMTYHIYDIDVKQKGDIHMGDISILCGSDKLITVKVCCGTSKIRTLKRYGNNYDKRKFYRFLDIILVFTSNIDMTHDIEHIEDSKARIEHEEYRRRLLGEVMRRNREIDERNYGFSSTSSYSHDYDYEPDYEDEFRRQQSIEDNDMFGYDDIDLGEFNNV